MTLTQEIEARLPWDAVGVVWYAAERHGLTLNVDEGLEDRCLAMLAQHLLLHAGHQESNPRAEDDARLLLAAMGDGFKFWAVIVGEGFISQLVNMRENNSAYTMWVDIEAA